METLWTVILGAVQGATEFLPVSSSGHLAAGQLSLGAAAGGTVVGDPSLTFEVLLHLATLLAVVVVYRRDIARLFSGGLMAVRALLTGQGLAAVHENRDAHAAGAIVIGTIPTAVIGFLARDLVAHVAVDSLLLGTSFLICAALLFSTRWLVDQSRPLTWKIALVIGLVQGLAVFPGISRSGVTIAAGLAFGLRRDEAARFSFLLSIPAILGAAALEADLASLTAEDHVVPFALGAFAAFAVGLAALVLLLHIVRRGKLWLFAPYVASIGLCSIFFL